MLQRLLIPLAVSLCLLSGLALAKPTADNPDKSSSSVTRSDRNWTIDAYQFGLSNLKLGKMATTRARAAGVRTFAKHMVAGHMKFNLSLKRLADKKGIQMATSDSSFDADWKKLNSLSGAAFDKEYLSTMAKGHQDAVTSFQKESAKGGDANLRAWATQTLPALQEKLTVTKKLQASIGQTR